MQISTATPPRLALGGGPEQFAYGHETGHQSWPQPAPFAYLKVPSHQPLVIDEAVRRLEPHALVRMEYARKQRHDAGADRDRKKADRQQRQPVARQELALRQLGQSPSGGGRLHRMLPKIGFGTSPVGFSRNQAEPGLTRDPFVRARRYRTKRRGQAWASDRSGSRSGRKQVKVGAARAQHDPGHADFDRPIPGGGVFKSPPRHENQSFRNRPISPCPRLGTPEGMWRRTNEGRESPCDAPPGKTDAEP